MTTAIDGTQLYNDAVERIRQLERLNATLAAEIDRMRPVIDRVNYVVLSGAAPARLIELSEAFATYKAGGIYEAAKEQG